MMRMFMLLVVLVVLSTKVWADVTDFLVENWCPFTGGGSCPATINDVITWQKRDLPGVTGPIGGYQASHSAFWVDHLGGVRKNYIEQTFTFSPFERFIPQSGDGGQLLYVGPKYVTGIETRDGAKPDENQYFVPAGCAVDGWIFMDVDNITFDWQSNIARLVDVPEPSGNCPPPAQSYTRWRLGFARYNFIWGKSFWGGFWTIISEHYSHPSISQSTTFERHFYSQFFGLIRWEAWVRDQSYPQAREIIERCPGVYIDNGPWPMSNTTPDWRLVDCRQWTNIQWGGNGVDTIRSRSWAP